MAMSDAWPEFRERILRLKAQSEDPEFQRRAAELEAREAENVRRQAERAARDAWRIYGVPELYWDDLAAPKETQALAVVRDFMAGPRIVLVLGGEQGRGKSFAAAHAVIGQWGLFLHATEFQFGNRFDAERTERLYNTRVLVLDDLGKESGDGKGWFESNLFALVDARIRGKRKTILTTNLAGRDFLARYCSGPLEPLHSRLGRYGQFSAATGADLRRERE